MENNCVRALGLIMVAKSQMSTGGNEFKTNVKNIPLKMLQI